MWHLSYIHSFFFAAYFSTGSTVLKTDRPNQWNKEGREEVGYRVARHVVTSDLVVVVHLRETGGGQQLVQTDTKHK